MKGLFFITAIYAGVLIICSTIKFILFSYKNKRNATNDVSKIYYVTNFSKKPKKRKVSRAEIAIKGSVIDKNNLDEIIKQSETENQSL